MAALPANLLHLADFYGIQVPEPPQAPAPDNRSTILRGLLASMGVDAHDEAACADAVAAHEKAQWQRVLPPYLVVREGWSPYVPVRLHAGSDFAAWITADGPVASHTTSHPQHAAHAARDDSSAKPAAKRPVSRVERPANVKKIAGVRYEEFTLEIPDDLALGDHTLTVEAGGITHSCPLIVVPDVLDFPETLAQRKAWGVGTQLYALRSDRSWGIGDAADLSELATWAGEQGADFVSVTSINSDGVTGTIDPDPYRPTTQLFLDPLAIRVEEVREFGYLSAAEHQLAEWHGDDARRLNQDVEIDRDSAWESKRAALAMVFAVGLSNSRRRSFEDFAASRGEALRQFALWSTLCREFGAQRRFWPEALREHDEAAIEQFADEHSSDIEFEAWLQWVAHEQFARAQSDALATGMRLGLVHDVTPGVVEDGADVWMNADDYADDVTVALPLGAERYVATGLAPRLPKRERETAFSHWRSSVRHLFELAGAVRLQNVGMLVKQWWVPGTNAADLSQGAYVRRDAEALLGLVLLEAHRAGGLVMADSPVALPEAVAGMLRERGVILTHPVWSRRTSTLVPLKDVPERSVAALGSRDSAPISAYLTGTAATEEIAYRMAKDVSKRRTDIQLQVARALRDLHAAGFVTLRADTDEQVSALHKYLRSSPSRLQAVRLADLVGDPHRPGALGASHVHASWRRSLVGPDERPITLDALMTSRRVKRLIRLFTED